MKRLGPALILIFSILADSASAEIAIDTESLQLRFSEFGDLNSVTACLPSCVAPNAQSQEFSSYRGFLSMNRDSEIIFDLERIEGDQTVQLVFRNSFSNEVRIWKVPHKGWILGLDVSRSQNMAMAADEHFGESATAGFGAWLETTRYVNIVEGGAIRQTGLDDDSRPLEQHQDWSGFRNRYWAAMIRPDLPTSISARTGPDQSEAQIDISSTNPGPSRFLIYAGPVEPGALASSHTGLEKLMYSGLWFWLRWICSVFFLALGAIHGLVANWGLAIILLSLAVQLIMRPFNNFAQKLQDDVKATESRVAPQLQSIKSEFKGAEQAERIVAMYKAENIHPLYSLKGLIGIAFIIPVFIGAFNMLAENIWLAGESFLWIVDISVPDALASLGFTIPFLGSELNALPFIMIALSIPATLLRNSTETNLAMKKKNNRNLVLMSVVFFLLFYTFPAGMVLYWVINNAVAVLESVSYKIRS